MRTKMTRVFGGIAMGGALSVAILGFGGAVAGAETPAPPPPGETCAADASQPCPPTAPPVQPPGQSSKRR